MIPFIVVGAIAALTVIVVALLKWKQIVDWFKGRKALKESDKHNVAFTIKDSLENGNFSVVQGIFNTETEEFLAGQKYEAKELDAEMEKYHAGKPLLILN